METEKIEIEASFILAMRNAGIELSHDVVCRITENSIEIGISNNDGNKPYTIAFGSSLELYTKQERSFGIGRKNEISFGSTGSFDPSERCAFNRTIHAASILKNWIAVCVIVNSHCKKYSDFLDDKYNKLK